MAPNKTKRLSSFNDPAEAACVPILKARRSSRMAIKLAFAPAKNKPTTTLSNPLLIDDSELPPQNPNPPVPPHNSKPVVDRPIRDRVRTFHGARPKITKKRRKFDSQEPENSLPELPVPELPTPEPDHELPAPHPMPAALRTSPRRAPTQPSRHPVTAAVRSSPPRPPPQPSRHPLAAAVRTSPRRAPPQPSRQSVAPQRSSLHAPAIQQSSGQPPRSSPHAPAIQQSSGQPPRSSLHAPAIQQSSAQPQRSYQHPPPPSIQEFSQQMSPHDTEFADEQQQSPAQPNEQAPKKSKSIRVKLGEDIGNKLQF